MSLINSLEIVAAKHITPNVEFTKFGYRVFPALFLVESTVMSCAAVQSLTRGENGIAAVADGFAFLAWLLAASVHGKQISANG